MKYRYLEKTYCPGSYGLIPVEPGDEYVTEGRVRFHLPAILIDIEEKPEEFVTDEIRVEEYAGDIPGRSKSDLEDDDLREPVVAAEVGPDEWRILDGWERIARAVKENVAMLPAIRVPSGQAMKYLLEEEDVRRYIEYWNFRAAYWERRDRINGFLNEDRPGYTEVAPDAEATWNAILAAAAGKRIEIPVRWNRWFSIHGDGSRVYIGEAEYMAPVCALTFDRIVRRREFMEVFPLYEEWEASAEEEEIRKRARKITISYEYIFAMIRHYAASKTEQSGQ